MFEIKKCLFDIMEIDKNLGELKGEYEKVYDFQISNIMNGIVSI